MSELCDGMPIPAYTVYEFEKVTPDAGGLDNTFDPAMTIEYILRTYPIENIVHVTEIVNHIVDSYPSAILPINRLGVIMPRKPRIHITTAHSQIFYLTLSVRT